MEGVRWYLAVGSMLVAVSLAASLVRRLPVSSAMVYVFAGFVFGKVGLGRLDAVEDAHFLEVLTELAVLISLFTCGLKLRVPLSFHDWQVPLRLAFVSMSLTVAAITLVAHYGLGMPWGLAILLGGVLAPTDPVLASDVQLAKPGDSDRVRFGLTGEAGLNDGTAFPLVMLGLGVLGHHELGTNGARWLLLDVLWAVIGGISIGFVLGLLVGKAVIFLRTRHREALGSDDFLALGLIALSYGVALSLHTYGFLAVFAAGIALRQMEARKGGDRPDQKVADQAKLGQSEEIQTHPDKGVAYMTEAVLQFNEQLERITELALMLLAGLLLASLPLSPSVLWFAPLFFLVIRPASVALGLMGAKAPARQLLLISWFGVRGIGSLYYLFFAATHGLPPATVRELASIVLSVIAASVFLHGSSVTPVMRRYDADRRESAA